MQDDMTTPNTEETPVENTGMPAEDTGASTDTAAAPTEETPQE